MYNVEGNLRFCLQLLQYRYIIVLCKHGLTAVYLVQARGEMAFLPAVTAVLLHHIALDTGTDCNFVSTGKRGNGVPVCSYCSSVTSHCSGYMD